MFQVATTNYLGPRVEECQSLQDLVPETDEELFSGTLRGANDFLHGRLG
jgi:hypothetical protein